MTTEIDVTEACEELQWKASGNDCSVWSFYSPQEGTDYGIGTEEEYAVADLAKKRSAQAFGFGRGILGGKGGWVLTTASGKDEWFGRGERLPAKAPEPTA